MIRLLSCFLPSPGARLRALVGGAHPSFHAGPPSGRRLPLWGGTAAASMAAGRQRASGLMLAALALLLLPGLAGAAETQPFVSGSWQALRQAHAGRPMIVHLWSLTCAPCLAELPQWGQLKGVDLVLVSTDPVEQAPRLQTTLARAGLAGKESWAFADSFAERLRFEIDRRWRGELPRTLLINADGGVTAFTGTLEAAELAAWLEREAPHAARP